MPIFFFNKKKEFLDEFERIRKIILKGKGNDIKPIIQLLLEELRNKQDIDDLAFTSPQYFSASVVKWEMEYDIALKILQYEMDAQVIKYKFEIINYLFSYFMSKPEIRYSFFLMHGLPLPDEKINITRIENLQSSDYVIYSRKEDLYFSYILNSNEFAEALYKNHKWSELDIDFGNDFIFILQALKTY